MLAGVAVIAGGIVTSGILEPARAGARETARPRDGTHDFDFNFGVWRTRIRRIEDPFGAPDKAIELNGTVTVRRIWGGKAALEEIEADGATGHMQGMTLFLYNPNSGQWSQTFANSKEGILQPSMTGEFRDGRGDLYAQDTFHGRGILTRGTWSSITPDAHRYMESYSDDGGQSWHPAFIAELTRLASKAPASAAPAKEADDAAHAFDFDMAKWHTRTERLVNPLARSTRWITLNGETDVQPVWAGKANLAVLEANGPDGPLQLISLRLYDPVAKQWNLNFATSGSGVRSVPMVGQFAGHRGTFYDQEPYGGRMIWVRFTIFPISPTSAQSEQAFSSDNGKTWETNFINHYSKVE
jgi:hypothetical protein